jgi:hypothetical protein
MAEKMPIRIRERATYASGTYAYVKSQIVPPGQIWCLQNISYENETGARGTFRRYIEGHGYDHFVSELQGPGAAELIFTSDVIYLLPGERLVVRQASCSAADVLALYAHGYKIFSKFLPDGEGA